MFKEEMPNPSKRIANQRNSNSFLPTSGELRDKIDEAHHHHNELIEAMSDVFSGQKHRISYHCSENQCENNQRIHYSN